MHHETASNVVAKPRPDRAVRRPRIAAAACALFVIGAVITVSASMPSAGAERAAERLDAIAAQFANFQAISFETDVTAHFVNPSHPDISTDTLIEGSFSYIASGDMWRKRSYLDPEHYPQMNTVKAYDGTFYQNHLLGEEDVLGLAVGNDARTSGMTLYNPLFLYAQFLIPLDESLNDVLPRHVRTAAGAWDGSDLLWEPTLSSYGKAYETVLPGATYNDQPYNVHVILPTDETAPIIMDATLDDGTLLLRTTFSQFTQKDMFGQTQSWPKRVVAEMYMGLPTTQITLVNDLYDIKTGEAAPSDQASYMLDWDNATHVWQDDDRLWLR